MAVIYKIDGAILVGKIDKYYRKVGKAKSDMSIQRRRQQTRLCNMLQLCGKVGLSGGLPKFTDTGDSLMAMVESWQH